jgi:uncharacterized protein
MNHNTKSTRPGWQVLGVFIVILVVSWIAGIVVGLLTRRMGLLLNLTEPVGTTLSWVGITAARLIFWLPAARWLLKRRLLRDLCFPAQRGWPLDLLGGIMLTTLVMLVVFILSQALGWLTVTGWQWQTLPLAEFAGLLWSSLLINILVALAEEIIFRGFLLTGLAEAWGKWPGLSGMIVVFGLIHLPAYAEQGMSLPVLSGSIALAGLIGGLFGLIYLRTRSLWLPVGIHFAWNFVENDLLNVPADMTNPYLIGAITQLRGALFPTDAGFGNSLALDWLAFALLALGVWWWLKRRWTRVGNRL